MIYGQDDDANPGDPGDVIFGGPGNDLIGGTGSNAYVDGGDGNDSLFMTGSNTIVKGGTGDDHISLSGVSSTITTGNGNDTLYFVDHVGVHEVYTVTDYASGHDSFTIFTPAEIGSPRVITNDALVRMFDVNQDGKVTAADGVSQTRAEMGYAFVPEGFKLEFANGEFSLLFAAVAAMF